MSKTCSVMLLTGDIPAGSAVQLTTDLTKGDILVLFGGLEGQFLALALLEHASKHSKNKFQRVQFGQAFNALCEQIANLPTEGGGNGTM